MTTAGELDDLRRELALVKSRLARMQLRPTPRLAQFTVQIVGGQLISGTVPVIQYVADPLTIPTAYDPTTTTSTVSGIGIGYLYTPSGQQSAKVLVRHNFTAMTDPVLAGNVYNVGPATTVSVSGGGTVLAYPIISAGG